MRIILYILLFYSILGCGRADTNLPHSTKESSFEAISLLGDTLYPPTPSDTIVARYATAKRAYEASPTDRDLLIWYGRFTAYMGNYKEAIEIFGRGVEDFPEDARFLRHRGHRYITIREWDKAIQDLEKASQLVNNRPDEIEPDGMPNPSNIPVSSLNTNIWYHLGLVKYLNNDFEQALKAYERGIEACTNDDMLVAFVHWKYMTLRLLGRNEEAQQALSVIRKDMNIIESFEYYKLCQMYRGLLSVDELSGADSGSLSGASEALKYGIANWHYYNGQRDLAKKQMQDLVQNGNWAGFGYMASETALANNFF